MVEIVSWVMIFVVNVVVIDASLTEIVTLLVSDKDVTGVALGVAGVVFAVRVVVAVCVVVAAGFPGAAGVPGSAGVPSAVGVPGAAMISHGR